MSFEFTNAPTSFIDLMNMMLYFYLDQLVIVVIDCCWYIHVTERNIQSTWGLFYKSWGIGSFMLNSINVSFGWTKLHSWAMWFWLRIFTKSLGNRSCSRLRVPTNITNVKSFLALVGYYHIFVDGFFKIALPITELIRKKESFNGLLIVNRVPKNSR